VGDKIGNMAGENSLGVIEERSAHSVREAMGGEGRELIDSGVSKRARNIAGHVAGAFSPDAAVKQNGQEAIVQLFGNWKIKDLSSLGDFVNSPDKKGVTPVRAGELEKLYWDFVDGVAIGTVWGTGVSGEVGEAITNNDADGIDALLGVGELKGMGRVVVDTAVTDQTIIKRLNVLGLQLNKGVNAERALTKTYEGIETAYFEGKIPDNEAIMVLAYLTDAIAASTVEVQAGGGDQAVLEELKKLNQINEDDKAREEAERIQAAKVAVDRLEASRKSTFEAMLLHKNQIQLDVFQQYAPEWMQREENKPLMQALVSLANASFYKWRYGDALLDVMTDMKGEAIFNAPNEILQQMYEIPGMKETVQYFVQEFFDGGVNGEGVFVLKLKEDPKDSKGKVQKEYWAGRLQNIQGELKAQVQRLTPPNGTLKESDAYLAVSTAFNWMYIGHMFEDADPDRRIRPCEAYVEQMRAFIYPARKGWGKQLGEAEINTEEGWGGQLGQWLTEATIRAKKELITGRFDGVIGQALLDESKEKANKDDSLANATDAEKLNWARVDAFKQMTDDDLVNLLKKEQNLDVVLYSKYVLGTRATGTTRPEAIHPFPRRLFGSFFTLTEVKLKGSKPSDPKVNLAEALFKKQKIDFIAGGSGANPYGGYYDVADSAGRLYKIVKGDKKASALPLGGGEKYQPQVNAWAHDFADARSKIQKVKLLAPHIRGREFMKWIIANCVEGGIYKYSSEMVLLTPDVSANQHIAFQGLFNTRGLVSEQQDQEWIMEEFHASGVTSIMDRNRIMAAMGPESATAQAINSGTWLVRKFTGADRKRAKAGVGGANSTSVKPMDLGTWLWRKFTGADRKKK
jgi:hypothetical protein